MTDGQRPRWLIDPYEEWLAAERLTVAGGLAIDLMSVATEPWQRFGVDAAAIRFDAQDDFAASYLLDIPPAKATEPIRHLYEAVFYVLTGSGSTSVEVASGERRTFEWGSGALFAVPLNMRYRFFNASGHARARILAVTNLRMIMKLFRSDPFVFGAPFDFTERVGEESHFRGDGTFLAVAEHRNQWATNFVPDLVRFDRMSVSDSRGRGSTNIMFVLADGTMHAHMSAVPPGAYKKAHRHIESPVIVQLSGAGYSLYWRDREFAAAAEEPLRIEWKYGLAHSPPSGMWHQHFNVRGGDARYLAVHFGSLRYPFFAEHAEKLARRSDAPDSDQIEYADENPAIARLFAEAGGMKT